MLKTRSKLLIPEVRQSREQRRAGVFQKAVKHYRDGDGPRLGRLVILAMTSARASKLSFPLLRAGHADGRSARRDHAHFISFELAKFEMLDQRRLRWSKRVKYADDALGAGQIELPSKPVLRALRTVGRPSDRRRLQYNLIGFERKGCGRDAVLSLGATGGNCQGNQAQD